MEELNNNFKQNLPNAVAVLVLGICSIVFCCAFVGLACGIIALVMAKKGRKLYQENPQGWSNYGQLNAGWICAIIGTILGGIYILYYIIIVAIIGTAIGGMGLSGFEHLLNSY